MSEISDNNMEENDEDSSYEESNSEQNSEHNGLVVIQRKNNITIINKNKDLNLDSDSEATNTDTTTISSFNNDSKINNLKKYNKNISISKNEKISIQEYVRKEIFPRIKILSEEITYKLIKEICEVKLDIIDQNVQEIKFGDVKNILKREICLKRGYVKQKIIEKMKSK